MPVQRFSDYSEVLLIDSRQRLCTKQLCVSDFFFRLCFDTVGTDEASALNALVPLIGELLPSCTQVQSRELIQTASAEALNPIFLEFKWSKRGSTLFAA